jgi:hypothetical protein
MEVKALFSLFLHTRTYNECECQIGSQENWKRCNVIEDTCNLMEKYFYFFAHLPTESSLKVKFCLSVELIAE